MSPYILIESFDWLILMTFQPAKGYFIGDGIAIIVHLYLHFSEVFS